MERIQSTALAALLTFVLLSLVACAGDQGASREAYPIGAVSPDEARRLVGTRQTVCGEVESATYARSSRGQPTFLNIDQPYPNQIFTVVIWGEDRAKFPSAPESLYEKETICATGTIETFQTIPQIEVRSQGQVVILR